MNRKPLEFEFSKIIKDMSENNPITESIIDEFVKTKGENITKSLLIILDDMNIRGTQIQNLYKMCNKDIQKLYEKIINISKEDIKKLNNMTFSINKNKAIYEGSSKDRQLNPERYIFTEDERNSIRSKKSKDMVKDILDNKQKYDNQADKKLKYFIGREQQVKSQKPETITVK